MKIVTFHLRAVIERVTEIEMGLRRLFVFENLDRDGVCCKYWVQNWECEDITDTLNSSEHKRITDALHEHYKSASNTKQN